MRVEAINPEDGVLETVPNRIGPVAFGELCDPPQTERAQDRIVENGGTSDLRDTDACMVNHPKAR
jgi:hypothetical protein